MAMSTTFSWRRAGQRDRPVAHREQRLHERHRQLAVGGQEEQPDGAPGPSRSRANCSSRSQRGRSSGRGRRPRMDAPRVASMFSPSTSRYVVPARPLAACSWPDATPTADPRLNRVASRRDGRGRLAPVGHVDVAGVRYELPDGRVLLDDVSFRVGEGAKVALVGANGAGKTTLLRIITGDLVPHAGAVTRSGGLGVMRQMVGATATTADRARPAALGVAAAGARGRGARSTRCELALMDADDEKTQMRYAAGAGRVGRRRRLRHRGRLGRLHARPALGRALRPGEVPRADARCPAASRSGWCWSSCSRGPDEVLLLDEPDNFLDVPGKPWLEERIRESPKTILFVSHDRELLANTATRVVTVELGAAGNTVWTHPGGFATYHEARRDRFARLRGAAPALGRGARQAQGAGADATRARRRTTTAWPRSTRRRRPGCASSRRPARRRRSRASSR